MKYTYLMIYIIINIQLSLNLRSVHAQPFKGAWAWVGVIEKIESPWIIISGEYKESVHLKQSSSSLDLKEGDWVVYMPHSKKLVKIPQRYFEQLTQHLDIWIYTQDVLHDHNTLIQLE